MVLRPNRNWLNGDHKRPLFSCRTHLDPVGKPSNASRISLRSPVKQFHCDTNPSRKAKIRYQTTKKPTSYFQQGLQVQIRVLNKMTLPEFKVPVTSWWICWMNFTSCRLHRRLLLMFSFKMKSSYLRARNV